MHASLRRLVWLLVAVGAVGCETPPAPVVDRPPGEAELPTLDPAPMALDAPELHALVDAQIRRDPGPLLEGLRSLDAAVARRSALALASVQERSATTALALRLSDERPGVADLAAFALGQTGGPDEAALLIEALGSASAVPLRRELIRAVGFTASQGQLGELMRVADAAAERDAVAMSIARTGTRELLSSEQVQWLVDHLSHQAPEVRSNAAYFFARAREAGNWRDQADSVRAALEGMEPTDAAVRFLIPGLAMMEDVADTPTFVRWSRLSTDWRVRAVAVQALRDRLGDDEARDAALLALDDPSPHVMEAAAAELGQSRPALQEDQARVVAWIEANALKWQPVALLFAGLAPLGEGERIEAWLDTLPTDATLARAAAVEALSRVPGTDHLDRLFLEARQDDPSVAAAAYRGLAAHWGNQRDAPALVDRFEEAFLAGLDRAHPTVVGTSARGLTDPILLERGSASRLEAALLSRDPTDPSDADATAALVSSLAQTRDPSWVDLLERYLVHPQAAVRAAAAEAIHGLTTESVDPTGPPDPEASAARRIDWAAFPGERPVLRLETTKGDVVVVLTPEEAPLTVQTVLRLAESGAYDGVPFHRVVPNFVVQGGDVGRLDGTGGPGFEIRTEVTRIPFQRGTLGMASAGRDTEGSQFFIMHARAPHLDGRYTAFGWVREGMDVVDRLLRGDRIVRIVRVS